MIFFSPSLYVTVSVWPSTPAAWLATVALVIVLLGKSQFEKPSGGCTPGGKMRIAVAFWLPSGCGEAVMARYEPSFMSESGAFTISLTGALSASLIFISPPSRAFAVNIPLSTLAMVARTRTDAGVCAVTIEAVKRKAMALAPAILRVIIAIIALPLLLLWLASLAASLKNSTLRYPGEFAWERAERRVRTR